MTELQRFAVLTLTASLWAAQARAQSIPAFITARGIAMGGTTAFASGAEAIYLNPAGLVLNKTYQLEADYGHDAAPTQALTSGNGFVASIVDSKSNPYIATGFSYRYASLSVDGLPAVGSVYDLSFATAIGKFAYFGIHGTYLNYTNTQHITGDVATMIPIGPVIASCVGTNLITVNSVDVPLGVIAGLAYTNKSSLSIGGDARWQWYDHQVYHSFSAGAEYVIAQMVPLRAGYFWDGFNPTINETVYPGGRYITGGTGFYFSSFGFDATYRHNLLTGENAWIFAVKIVMGNQ